MSIVIGGDSATTNPIMLGWLLLKMIWLQPCMLAPFVGNRWCHILLQLWLNVVNLEYVIILYLWYCQHG